MARGGGGAKDALSPAQGKKIWRIYIESALKLVFPFQGLLYFTQAFYKYQFISGMF